MVMFREGELLAAKAGFGPEEKLKGNYSERMGEGFCGALAAANRPCYVEDAQSDPAYASPFVNEMNIKTMLGVPIRHGSDVMGAIHIDWHSPHPRSEKETQLLEIVADRIGLLISNAKLHEKSRDADSLGAVLNEINTSISSSLNITTEH